MLYLLAVVFPPAAVHRTGRPAQVVANICLTCLFWIPGVVHAWRVVGARPHETVLEAVVLEADGNYDVEVKGESHYQDALREIVGDRSAERAVRQEVQAALVPEPTNKYDRDAVQVYIEGRLVGYLSRDDAADYADLFARLRGRNKVATCPALIIGGGRTKDGRRRRSYGVWLDMPEPDE